MRCRFLLRRPALVADKPLTLDVDDFAAALRFCGYDADTDEAECILANVIAKVRAPRRSLAAAWLCSPLMRCDRPPSRRRYARHRRR